MTWPSYQSALPPDSFRGRRNAITLISGRLGERAFSSTSVVGGPRTGKTSLLQYLASTCADEHLPNLPAGLRVYLDVEILSSNGTSFDFWISFFRQLLSQNPAMDAVLAPVIEKAKNQQLSLYNLEDVFDECARRKLQIVGFVDNWDFLLRNLNFWPPVSNFLHLVRYFGQRTPRTVAWVVSSKRPLQELWDSSRSASPYYNIFVSVDIPSLESEDISDFYATAAESAGAAVDPDTEELIRDASFGHPFLVSYVTCRWLEKLAESQPIDPAEIARAFRDPAGPLVALVTEIRAALAPSERQILDQARTSGQLTANQKAKLKMLASYGLVPPGTKV
jgi:hypothetical protein